MSIFIDELKDQTMYWHLIANNSELLPPEKFKLYITSPDLIEQELGELINAETPEEVLDGAADLIWEIWPVLKFAKAAGLYLEGVPLSYKIPEYMGMRELYTQGTMKINIYLSHLNRLMRLVEKLANEVPEAAEAYFRAVIASNFSKFVSVANMQDAEAAVVARTEIARNDKLADFAISHNYITFFTSGGKVGKPTNFKDVAGIFQTFDIPAEEEAKLYEIIKDFKKVIDKN